WQEMVEQIAAKYDLVIELKSPRVWVLSRPPRVSISLQDASLSVVLDAIARAADVNIIMAGDVASSSKKISLTLKGVPWRYALDVVVKTVDLAWIEQEYKIVRIVSPGALQKDHQTRILRVNYGEAKGLADAVGPAMSDGKVQIDANSNSLILTGTQPAIEAAQRIADQLDQRTREVLIEMKFVDYSTLDVQGLGIDPINLNFDIDGVGTLAQKFTPFGSTFTTQSVIDRAASVPTKTALTSASLTFEAIASLTSTDILQSPQVLTLDNTEATIVIGRELHFAEETVATDNGVTTRTLKEASTSPVKDGVNIKVKPHITADGYIQIVLEASNDEAQLTTFSTGSGASASSIQLPNKNTTSLKHTIMVADGRTAVIGGLLKDKDQRQDGHVPGLGSIPVLGWFFRKTHQQVEKRNLTIFITPRIVPLGKESEYDKSLKELKARLGGVQEAAPATEAKSANSALSD
ncbi:MAG: secretin N-terminal domain-containing protein, partial [Planctomycetota bacterium]